jgi:hypothetical protein
VRGPDPRCALPSGRAAVSPAAGPAVPHTPWGIVEGSKARPLNSRGEPHVPARHMPRLR